MIDVQLNLGGRVVEEERVEAYDGGFIRVYKPIKETVKKVNIELFKRLQKSIKKEKGVMFNYEE